MSKRGRPKGYKESPETKAKKRASMLDRFAQRQPPLDWSHRLGDDGWKRFGDRLDFLSEEAQHATTGQLAILPSHAQEKAQEEGVLK